MPLILDGRIITKAITQKLSLSSAELREKGIIPSLVTVRLGSREDDIAYEKGASKRCASVGIEVRNIVMAADTKQNDLIAQIKQLNNDPSVHGVLIFMPLPIHIDRNVVCAALDPSKDADGITPISQVGVYTGQPHMGFPPCTAQACMEIIKYYGFDIAGRNAVVLGRSQIVGKPAAMLLLEENATVTICHSRSQDAFELAQKADLLISAIGRPGFIDAKYLHEGQIVIDVGTSADAQGRLCGDIKWDEAQMVKAITPVPGGVGAVTNAILAKHVIQAAQQSYGRTLTYQI
ncbi:MAG: bifunctional 5,10-methylenetetrahydrofolate dehydrogenase/5,10-methenyltetrahydrofolate cyclohydrolase [Candidatus Bruticola sp.]